MDRGPRPARQVAEWVSPALEHLDYLLPNEEQALGLTGASDLESGCAALLDRGVGCVAVTLGAEGAVVAHRERSEAVPAFASEVVDTTGCGDALSAGFIRGLMLGRTRREAAVLGCAAAALVAQGLGSDHGRFDLAVADGFAAATDTISANSRENVPG